MTLRGIGRDYMARENQEFHIEGMTFIYKKDMSIEEWLDTRMDGVGGSDIGVVLGVNPWMCATRLFFEKLGQSEPKDLDAVDSVHWGRLYEDILREQSQYWDNSDPNGYMKNYWKKKRKTASHVDFPFFVINDTFPHLRMNVDGLGFNDISVTEKDVNNMIFNGILPKPDKVVEIKRINERATERWDLGYPPGYWFQVSGYLAAWAAADVPYGEIYSQVGGNKFEKHHIPFHLPSINQILTETTLFWEKVELGKRILAELPVEEAEAELWHIAPEASGIYDYYDFISESEIDKLRDKETAVAGNDEILEWGLKYKENNEAMKVAEGKKNKYRNLILEYMTKNQTRVIDFGSEGRIKFNKRIYVNVKI